MMRMRTRMSQVSGTRTSSTNCLFGSDDDGGDDEDEDEDEDEESSNSEDSEDEADVLRSADGS